MNEVEIEETTMAPVQVDVNKDNLEDIPATTQHNLNFDHYNWYNNSVNNQWNSYLSHGILDSFPRILNKKS